MKPLVLLARVLYSGIFIMGGVNHLTNPQMVQYAASSGVPMPSILVPLSGVIALLGGLSILLGFKARIGGWLIVLFLVPVTLMMHNFWAVADPQVRMVQMTMFTKNLAMLGGAILIAYFGSGPVSLEHSGSSGGPTRMRDVKVNKAA